MNRLAHADAQRVADALTAYVSHQHGQAEFEADGGPHAPHRRHWGSAAALTVTVWAAEVRGPNGSFSVHWSRADRMPSAEWCITTAKALCVLAGVTA